MSHPPKILLLYAHPEPYESIANKALLSAISDLQHVHVHDLYAHYPDNFIDVDYEQKLLCQHEVIIFQHPLYTYSCPALLKEWFDRVLTRRFATDLGDQKLKGKYWRSVITTGEPKDAYQSAGYNRYPLNELLRPFELTAGMCEMHWLEPIIIYAARQQSAENMKHYTDAYRQWLQQPLDLGSVT